MIEQYGRWPVLIVLVVVSFFLNTWNNDFPVEFHADEGAKAVEILEHTQTFQHPLLIIQINRIAQAVFPSSDEFTTVRHGRTISACAQAGSVVLFYALLLYCFPAGWALIGAAAWAFSPIAVVHAHYLKEDILLTFCLLGTLLSMARWTARSGWWQAGAAGLLLGFAASTKYVGILMAVVIAFVMLIPDNEKPRKFRLGQLAVVLLSAALVFLIVNAALFVDPDNFVNGLRIEMKHMSEGYNYDVLFYPLRHAFLFHLRNSVWPGMTPVVAAFCLAGLGMMLVRWRSRDGISRMVFLYVMLFYLVSESSPVKPAPDFMRYILPIIPGLLFCGLDLLRRILNTAFARRHRYMAWLAAAAFLIIPLVESLRLTRDMDANTDTRTRAAAYVREQGGSACTGAIHFHLDGLPLSSIAASDAAFLVVDSFDYDKYMDGGILDGQQDSIYRRYRIYRELFTLPYVEFLPRYKSFAYANPTIRIFRISDLRSASGK